MKSFRIIYRSGSPVVSFGISTKDEAFLLILPGYLADILIAAVIILFGRAWLR
jgi:hypothetical protein